MEPAHEGYPANTHGTTKDKYVTVKQEYNNGDNQNRLCCSITSLIISCWFLPSIATVQFVPEHVSYIMGTHYFNLYQVCYFFQSKCYHLYKDWIWINTELAFYAKNSHSAYRTHSYVRWPSFAQILVSAEKRSNHAKKIFIKIWHLKIVISR